MSRESVGALGTVGLLLATVLLVAPPSGAAGAAAACRGASGVTVVVDFAELGGGVTAGCAPNGGGRSAVEVFRDAGYSLEYSTQPGMNGYVCKVQGKPADGDCAANDTFWSLWWSDGRSGRWVFASRGVGVLEVPDGGYLAWAWHEGAGRAQPPAARPEPRQTQASDGPRDNGGNGGGNGSGGTDGGKGGKGDADGDGSDAPTSTAPSPSASNATTGPAPASESASGRGMRKKRGGREASTSPTATGTDGTALPNAAEITDGPPPADLGTEGDGDEGGSLPTWIGLALAVVVLGAAGAVTVLRRRAG